MDTNTRHERIAQLQSEMGEALELRAKYQAQFDALYAEYELLEAECFDQNCPCTDDDN